MSHPNVVLRRSPRLAATLLFAAALGALSLSSAAAQEVESEPADAIPVRQLESVNLVTFQIGNLSEVQISAVSEIGEVSVTEIIAAGPEERFVLQPGQSPVEVFLRLAPRDTPVPEAIAAMDTRKLLADRRIVATLNEPILVAPRRLGLAPRLQTKAGGGSCQGGAAGATYFQTNHCGQLGGPGYGSSESYCDQNAANSIQRTTGSRRRATYTRFASCGSGTNRLRHFYGTASGFDTQVDKHFAAGQVLSSWSYVKGVKRHRRVRFEEDSASGWVRGWTKYHSEVADGW